MTTSIGWLRAALVAACGIGAALVLARGPYAPHALALAGAELVACALLAVPATRRAGGWLLLATLAAAAVVHGVAGELPTALAVYAAATVVVMREAP
ncbi:MAG TPA: hypothetical protein VLX92_24140 [Kofleriaceae bacterium]|nr:hypothetical protein [Kofleriaceae bacterium]